MFGFLQQFQPGPPSQVLSHLIPGQRAAARGGRDGRGTVTDLQSPLFLKEPPQHRLFRCSINSSQEFSPHESVITGDDETRKRRSRRPVSRGNDFLPVKGTSGCQARKQKPKFKHTQSRGAPERQPRPLTHRLPAVLEGRSTEAKEGHGSKQELWGHADLGSEPPFTSPDRATMGELAHVSKPHLLPWPVDFCSTCLITL